MRKIQFLNFAVILFFFQFCRAQIILTEVMFKPDTLSNYNEYVEIYNAGDTTVNLAGWKVGDGDELDFILPADSSSRLLPGQFGIILDPGYFGNSTTYDALIPAAARRLTIDDNSFGKQGFANTRSEAVTLVNSHGDTIQVYPYSPGNAPGFSDEKINLVPDNGLENWADGRTFRGTPGFKNSVSPKNIDLALTAFIVESSSAKAGGELAFTARAANLGLETINGFDYDLFYDQNGDRREERVERIKSGHVSGPIASGDSLEFSDIFPDLPAGRVRAGVKINAAGDEDSLNNEQVKEIYVLPGGIKVVLNEIMFEPEPGQSEWIELFNAGGDSLDVSFLNFADARDTVRLASRPEFLPAHSYLVVGGDSSLLDRYGEIPAKVNIINGFPTLNNDADALTLCISGGSVLDAVTYSKDWYGREVAPGVSLERINPLLPSQDPENWAASVDASGATPGKENSIFTATKPTTRKLQITPNPFSPDGDGFEDVAIISLELPASTAFVNIRIFDTRGREIRTLAKAVPTGRRATFIWNGKDDEGRTARIGAYICFVEALNGKRRSAMQLKAAIFLMKK